MRCVLVVARRAWRRGRARRAGAGGARRVGASGRGIVRSRGFEGRTRKPSRGRVSQSVRATPRRTRANAQERLARARLTERCARGRERARGRRRCGRCPRTRHRHRWCRLEMSNDARRASGRAKRGSAGITQRGADRPSAAGGRGSRIERSIRARGAGSFLARRTGLWPAEWGPRHPTERSIEAPRAMRHSSRTSQANSHMFLSSERLFVSAEPSRAKFATTLLVAWRFR